MNQSEEIYNYLNSKIWITKKIRMDAAENRQKWAHRIKYLLSVLAVLDACASVLSLANILPSSIHFDIFSSIFSVSLMGVAFFVTGDGLQKQADNYKNSYHALEMLTVDFENLFRDSRSDQNDSDTIAQRFDLLKKEYVDILNQYINHTNRDFRRFSKKNIHSNMIKRINDLIMIALLIMIFLLLGFILWLICAFI